MRHGWCVREMFRTLGTGVSSSMTIRKRGFHVRMRNSSSLRKGVSGTIIQLVSIPRSVLFGITHIRLQYNLHRNRLNAEGWVEKWEVLVF